MTIDPIVHDPVPDFGMGGQTVPPIPFKIDGEMFYAVGSQPASLIFDLAAMSEGGQDMNTQVKTFTTLIQGMLVPESFERLKAKMRDPLNPLSWAQMMKLIEWLMERYGNRPTTPASSSPQPSVATNLTSTVGAPQPV